jgi:hypothetical protein
MNVLPSSSAAPFYIIVLEINYLHIVLNVYKGHKFVFIIYSDIALIHHLGQAGVDRVTICHQKRE